MSRLLPAALFLLTSFLSGCTNSSSDRSVEAEHVVLAHGLARSELSMWRMKDRLESAGYNVCAIDYATIRRSLAEVKAQTGQEIENCLPEQGKVHFVGHSLGGLMIRNYLARVPQEERAFELGEVLLMATPNKGSEVADAMQGHFLMSLGPELAVALSTGEESLGRRLPTPDYAPGVIAGTRDLRQTRRWFEGPNDGLVSVESAQLETMKDFVTVNVSHSAMRQDAATASQAIHFLRHGRFRH